MAVLFRAPATGQTTWVPVARTEMQVNSVNPAWVRPLLSAYNPQAQQPVKLVLYDVDSTGKDGDTRKINLEKQDYIGEGEQGCGLVHVDVGACRPEGQRPGVLQEGPAGGGRAQG